MLPNRYQYVNVKIAVESDFLQHHSFDLINWENVKTIQLKNGIFI